MRVGGYRFEKAESIETGGTRWQLPEKWAVFEKKGRETSVFRPVSTFLQLRESLVVFHQFTVLAARTQIACSCLADVSG